MLVADLICKPGSIEVPKKSRKVKKCGSGHIKMNVDGFFFFFWVSGRRGNWGVFRNAKGEVILKYAKKVCVNLAIHAELMAL